MRVHTIRADFPVEAAEGAFAVPSEAPGRRPCDSLPTAQLAAEDRALAHGPLGSTGIYAVTGYARGEVVRPEPNTNLMVPRTLIPTLHAAIVPGVTRLACAVWADTRDEAPDSIPEEVLEIAQRCE